MRVDSITYPSGKKIIYLTVLNDHDSFFGAAHRFNVSYRFMEGVGPMLGIFPHERNPRDRLDFARRRRRRHRERNLGRHAVDAGRAPVGRAGGDADRGVA